MILVLDTETTGIDPTKDKVIELAGVGLYWDSFADWTIDQTWDGLIQPNCVIPPEVSAIHHLTKWDFDRPGVYGTLSEAWRVMREIVCGETVSAFVAHNAQFDRGFLPHVLGDWLCTLRCAKHLYPDAPGYGNQVLRYYLGLRLELPSDLSPHRALYDAIVTAHILMKMLEIKTLDELMELQTKPVLLKTCNMRKYKGQLWKEIPKDFLRWILRTGDFDVDVMYTAKYWVDNGR